MITNNFKAFINTMLHANGSSGKGLMQIKNTGGTLRYCAGGSRDSFPVSVTTSITTSVNGAGIIFGSGDTPATADDYVMELPITSGISGSIVRTDSVDENEDPYTRFDITLTNTSGSSITVNEIGYQQRLLYAASQGASYSSYEAYLLDRTVFDDAITIPSGEYAVIRYTLKTVIS